MVFMDAASLPVQWLAESGVCALLVQRKPLAMQRPFTGKPLLGVGGYSVRWEGFGTLHFEYIYAVLLIASTVLNPTSFKRTASNECV